MRNTIFVIGTRAQIVKIAPVLQRAVSDGLQHTVWFTGQHQESVADLLEDFALKSTFVLPNKHAERSSIFRLLVWIPAMLISCFRFIARDRKQCDVAPLVVVHGDTLSTWLGALAGRWAGAKIVHLESGLTSGHWNDPFPEELLRRLTFRLSNYALCPNSAAAARMQGFANCEVIDTQENTLLDCVRYAVGQKTGSCPADGSGFIVTIHRFQNIYSRPRLQNIVAEVLEAAKFGEVQFILHPPTLLRLRKYRLLGALQDDENVQLLSRKPYTEFLELMSNARAVFSDGGSNQEELSYLGVPTILYRERSERPDGLDANIALRGNLPGSVTSLLENGDIDKLRKPSRINSAAQPSLTTVNALLEWSETSASRD